MMLLERLMVATALPLPELVSIIYTAPRRYKVYYIAKKHGGLRQIAHPARELKFIQRYVLENYLSKYPVHPAAAAYVRGKNILHNATVHAEHPWFLKLDFQDFFPSIRVSDWIKFVSQSPEKVFNDKETDIAVNILFWGAGGARPTSLSIGAPTSPMVSNIILFDLDSRLSMIAKESGLAYTRYADDITVSGESIEQVLSFEKALRREIAQLQSPKLKFNDTKRGLYGRSGRRMVTGLIVTPDGVVSLGRERKRLISALLHKFGLGQLDLDQRGLLKGMLGFAIANEPAFLDRMRRKYGDATLDKALRMHIPSRRERQTGGDEP